VLLCAALALTPAPTVAQGVTLTNLREKTCTDLPDLAARELLQGLHLRIGLYAGELAECKKDAPECRLYQSISRADNKEGRPYSFKVWSGFDVELLEELAERGGFNYTIVSMGGGHAESVGKTDYNGGACNIEKTPNSGLPNCSSYTEKAKIMLGLEPSLVHMSDHGGMVDVIGQGTWKVNSDRESWAIWSSSVVSSDTLLLTKPMQYEEVEYGADLMFRPFKNEVWVLLFALVIVFAGIFKVSATKFKKTAMEISPADIGYYTFMQPCGKDLIDVNQAKIKGISMGWIIFSVVMMEFWFAGLVSELVREGTYTTPVSWKDLTSSGETLTLCVENTGANDLYFTELATDEFGLGYSYKMGRTNNTKGKIDGVLDGLCHGSEVTREDYNKDTRFHGTGQCPAVLHPNAIAQRTRGMMSRRNNTCVVTGINALIHSYSIQKCTSQSSNHGKCNLFALWTANFPEPTCEAAEKEDHGEAIALNIEAITSPLAVLFVFTVFGALGTFVGRRNERRSVWPFSLFLESPEAQHVRTMQKLEELNTAASAMQTSKSSMKRRKSAGLSILPPPTAPPPDDGKSKKPTTASGGSAATATATAMPVLSETQKILQKQLETARQRAHVAQPTNHAYDHTYSQQQQAYGAYGAQPYGAQNTGYPQPSAAENLPAGWSSAMDYASGHMYYINHQTQMTQWTAPTPASGHASPYATSQPTASGTGGFANLGDLFKSESKV
jgi:hypothetical protein